MFLHEAGDVTEGIRKFDARAGDTTIFQKVSRTHQLEQH